MWLDEDKEDPNDDTFLFVAIPGRCSQIIRVTLPDVGVDFKTYVLHPVAQQFERANATKNFFAWLNETSCARPQEFLFPWAPRSLHFPKPKLVLLKYLIFFLVLLNQTLLFQRPPINFWLLQHVIQFQINFILLFHHIIELRQLNFFQFYCILHQCKNQLIQSLPLVSLPSSILLIHFLVRTRQVHPVKGGFSRELLRIFFLVGV